MTKQSETAKQPESVQVHPTGDPSNDIELAVSEAGPKDKPDNRVVDAVWGTIEDDGPNYRNLGWIRASVLEVKTQIGLGILGLVCLLPLPLVPSCYFRVSWR
jgi:hypothetical protein